jgi:hypothetical protein
MRVVVLVVGFCSMFGGCAPLGGALRQPPPPSVVVATAGAVGENEDALFDEEPTLGCVDHPMIDAWEDRLRWERPFWAATLDGVARGTGYLPRLRAIVEEEGVPSSLALLPVVESGFRNGASAPDGGRGLWQLRPQTARRFGLVVGARRDDRLHPERATRAAARYLRLLHDHYGDWPLALAAYNAGEGRVDRALIRRPGASFWELAEHRHLPRVSRDYVPRFLALLRVVGTPPDC